MAKEYIEREAVEKELKEELDFESPRYTAEQNKHIDIGLKIALRAIKKATAADVVEVVRCGECERRSKSADLTDTVYCPWLKQQMRKTDFCSYGERRDG